MGPMFRHLFGVSEDEVMSWPTGRWERHRAYAVAWAKAQGWEV